MAQYDVTQPISAYSTHFFPPNVGVPVFITVYKMGSASADDVAGHLMFTDLPLAGAYRDRLQGAQQAIVKNFRLGQFAGVLQLLQQRLDHFRQGMSMHYVGDETAGGWTTLDAGASPGLDPELLPLVTPPRAASFKAAVAPAKKPAVKKKRAGKK
jgi:hypothetical protein